MPASFDEAARELTLQAATQRGLSAGRAARGAAGRVLRVDRRQRARRSGSAPGERVLVFDVGGGTTDFTLIEVDADGDGFTRTAVGDHLLLGGDNLDLTLAKIVEQRVVARERQEARRAAVARPRPRVPAREGDAARRRAARDARRSSCRAAARS